MRVRVVLLTSAAALAVLYLLMTISTPDVSDRRDEPARVPRTVRGAGDTAPAIPSSLRNVFEYSEAVSRPATPVATQALTPATPPPFAAPEPSPSPLVRLVGLVRRGAQTRAALAIAGDTVVLAAGESAAGYTVVSIDEDEGVRVRMPDGVSMVLAAGRDQ